jgi:hypothetical protein
VELALIFADCGHHSIKAWLRAGMEQQSIDFNRALRQSTIQASNQELNACYRASYTSMIISINYMHEVHRRPDSKLKMIRPDLHCMVLLLRAEGSSRPSWWGNQVIIGRLRLESQGLTGTWKDPAAWLLGLAHFPSDHDFNEWNL